MVDPSEKLRVAAGSMARSTRAREWRVALMLAVAQTSSGCVCPATHPYCWSSDNWCYESATSYSKSSTCGGSCTDNHEVLHSCADSPTAFAESYWAPTVTSGLCSLISFIGPVLEIASLSITSLIREQVTRADVCNMGMDLTFRMVREGTINGTFMLKPYFTQPLLAIDQAFMQEIVNFTLGNVRTLHVQPLHRSRPARTRLVLVHRRTNTAPFACDSRAAPRNTKQREHTR
eukprot:2519020-Prymnesium_polylepis.2